MRRKSKHKASRKYFSRKQWIRKQKLGRSANSLDLVQRWYKSTVGTLFSNPTTAGMIIKP